MGGQFSRQESADPGPSSAEGTSLFKPGELRDYSGFVLRAVRRRWKLVSAIVVIFAGATAAVIPTLPRRYHVEARLFALPGDGAPGVLRGNNGEPIGLAQGAAAVIAANDNLNELIYEKDLLRGWQTSRAPMLRLWDRVRYAFVPVPDEIKHRRALVHYLRKHLTVQVKGPDVILGFDWPEAQTAFEVVRTAEEKLLAIRRAAELIPLERKVSTLESSANHAQRRIDAAVAAIEAAVKEKREGARSSTVRGLQAQGRFRHLPDPRLAAQRLQLIARRKTIGELEDVRRKRLSELNATLAEQKATLGPGHPVLLDTEEKIRAFERQSSELEALKVQEQELFAEYVRAGGKEIELSTEPDRAWPMELKEDDEPMAYGKARIGMELSGLQYLLAEAAQARVALSSARASFDSRYMVLVPAEPPEKPESPNSVLLIVAGVLGGLLLAVFGAVATDLRGSAIRESWQVRRQLDLAVLAEVPEP
jgi:hypothetical protein